MRKKRECLDIEVGRETRLMQNGERLTILNQMCVGDEEMIWGATTLTWSDNKLHYVFMPNKKLVVAFINEIIPDMARPKK